MTQTPQEWSLKLACERAVLNYETAIGGGFGYGIKRSVFAHALTIEQHEQEPVDPDLIEARECVALYYEQLGYQNTATTFRKGEFDSHEAVKAVLIAIKRTKKASQ